MKKLSSDCDLLELREWLLRDMSIIGLNDKSLQERLLRESNLDITKTIDTCRTVEVTRSHARAIQNGNPLAEFDVDPIRKHSPQHRTQPSTQSSNIVNKSFVCICTKEDPVQLMGNFVIIAKRRNVFQSVD